MAQGVYAHEVSLVPRPSVERVGYLGREEEDRQLVLPSAPFPKFRGS